MVEIGNGNDMMTEGILEAEEMDITEETGMIDVMGIMNNNNNNNNNQLGHIRKIIKDDRILFVEDLENRMMNGWKEDDCLGRNRSMLFGRLLLWMIDVAFRLLRQESRVSFLSIFY